MQRSQASVFVFLGALAACQSSVARWSAQGGQAAEVGVASSIASAAANAIASLDAAQRAKACFEFSDAERTNWQFVPGQYPGVSLAELSLAQKQSVHALLHSVLSAQGYQKTTAIMRLEDTLREYAQAAGRTKEVPTRDPGRYSVAFFGKPSGGTKAPWGFRLQGHHISWNFTSANPRVVAVPMFLGTNPAEVRKGHHAGYRALADEEDLARELLASFDAAQRRVAIVDTAAPKDVFWGPGKLREVIGEPRGLTHAAMLVPQRQLLWRLIETYAHNLRREVADQHLQKIEAAGRAQIRFAWMGSDQKGEGHYYRVHGPTFVIEYDNTQNGANHAHCVWHDLTDDFAVDWLREHHQHGHGDHDHAHGDHAAVALPRVLILGDSISMGYTGPTRQLLKGTADVFRPMQTNRKGKRGPENCAGTDKGIQHIDRWLAADGGKWDVIHFNFGLHDLKRVHPETGRNSNDPAHPRQSEVDDYLRQLTTIVDKLQATGAKLVFATTTPYPAGVKPLREPADAGRYNAAAVALMKERGIPVNDLYSFVEPRMAELQRPVNVHFSPKGSRALAREVARHVRQTLAR